MTTKICNICQIEFPIYGRSGKCRECRNRVLREQRLLRKDDVNKKNREQYIKHKARFRKTQRKYEQKRAALEHTDKIRHAKSLIFPAKTRAKRFNVPFDITYKDIPIPEYCPVLNIKLVKNTPRIKFNSATVDRINPKLGYIKGNVIVISCKANQIKNNGTPDDILKVGLFFKNLENKDISYES